MTRALERHHFLPHKLNLMWNGIKQNSFPGYGGKDPLAKLEHEARRSNIHALEHSSLASRALCVNSTSFALNGGSSLHATCAVISQVWLNGDKPNYQHYPHIRIGGYSIHGNMNIERRNEALCTVITGAIDDWMEKSSTRAGLQAA
ncbi:hypothetical protein K2Q00_03775 [Patescibacteria group bacterium]|nr:hypothetical protein [Patescibacteria group bacterium]